MGMKARWVITDKRRGQMQKADNIDDGFELLHCHM